MLFFKVGSKKFNWLGILFNCPSILKWTVFFPIKLKSQRLPNKMLLPLGDKVLCQHIFDILLDVKKKKDMDIYCYCSNEEIIKYLPIGIKF